MKFACILLTFVLMLSPTTLRADIIFSISPNVAGPIVEGSSVVYSIKIASSGSDITNLAGIDFVINANDPALTGGATSGGSFVSGTSTFFTGGGFRIPFPTSTQIFGAQGATPFVTQAPVDLATLTLSTVGATPGNYLLGFQVLTVLDSNAANIAVQAPASFAYTISAVPEPTSVLFLVGTLSAAGVRMMRTRRTLRREKTV